MIEDGVLLGVISERLSGAEGCPTRCCMMLNPPDDFTLIRGDRICVVAKDSVQPLRLRVTQAPANAVQAAPSALPAVHERVPNQRLLICNWRDDMEDVLTEMDKRVGPGTTVTVSALAFHI